MPIAAYSLTSRLQDTGVTMVNFGVRQLLFCLGYIYRRTLDFPSIKYDQALVV
jgi:hypothetical protein